MVGLKWVAIWLACLFGLIWLGFSDPIIMTLIMLGLAAWFVHLYASERTAADERADKKMADEMAKEATQRGEGEKEEWRVNLTKREAEEKSQRKAKKRDRGPRS